MARILAMGIPALLIVVTLFGVLARGNPKPGGVALFWRVGLVGVGLGAGTWYFATQTAIGRSFPTLVHDGYRGLLILAGLIVVVAAIGSMLKRAK
jgi:hypothetical protein